MENTDETSQGQNIQIQVRDPILEESGGFTSYSISGVDKQGAFEIRRRQGLKKRFPGCYIPPIPQKKGNKQQKLVEDRKRFLDYFCKQIAKAEYLYYSQTFQLLIRGRGTDLQKLIDAQSTPKTDVLIQFYKDLCPKELPKQRSSQARAKANNFNAYLKKAEKQLKILRDDVKQVTDAKRAFNDNLNVCNTIMIPEYQKNVFAQYVNHNSEYLLFNSNPQISQKVRELKEVSAINSFDFLYALVAVELREVQSFQEAIQARQNVQDAQRKLIDKRRDNQGELSKLISGKTTFKSFFTKGNKQQQKKTLQTSIENDQKQIDNLTILIDLISVYQGQLQLPKFKVSKQKQYYDILNTVAKTEVKHLSIYGGLMKAILSANQNTKFE